MTATGTSTRTTTPGSSRSDTRRTTRPFHHQGPLLARKLLYGFDFRGLDEKAGSQRNEKTLAKRAIRRTGGAEEEEGPKKKKAKYAPEWWYKTDDGTDWKPMNTEDAALLEDAWLKGPKAENVELSGFSFSPPKWTYVVDFKRMTQTNPVRKTVRQIARGEGPGKKPSAVAEAFPTAPAEPWQWWDGGAWKDYDADTAHALEVAYKRGTHFYVCKRPEFLVARGATMEKPYIFDFRIWTQINTEAGTSRSMRRGTAGASEGTLTGGKDDLTHMSALTKVVGDKSTKGATGETHGAGTDPCAARGDRQGGGRRPEGARRAVAPRRAVGAPDYGVTIKSDAHATACFDKMLHREGFFAGKYAVFYHSYCHAALLYEVQAAVAAVLFRYKSEWPRVPRLIYKPFEHIPNAQRMLQEFPKWPTRITTTPSRRSASAPSPRAWRPTRRRPSRSVSSRATTSATASSSTTSSPRCSSVRRARERVGGPHQEGRRHRHRPRPRHAVLRGRQGIKSAARATTCRSSSGATSPTGTSTPRSRGAIPTRRAASASPTRRASAARRSISISSRISMQGQVRITVNPEASSGCAACACSPTRPTRPSPRSASTSKRPPQGARPLPERMRAPPPPTPSSAPACCPTPPPPPSATPHAAPSPHAPRARARRPRRSAPRRRRPSSAASCPGGGRPRTSCPTPRSRRRASRTRPAGYDPAAGGEGVEGVGMEGRRRRRPASKGDERGATHTREPRRRASGGYLGGGRWARRGVPPSACSENGRGYRSRERRCAMKPRLDCHLHGRSHTRARLHVRRGHIQSSARLEHADIDEEAGRRRVAVGI